MSGTTGNSSHERKSSVIDAGQELSRGRLVLLLALGAGIVLLGEVFRFSLALPGHHGLEAMALLVLGRLCCTNAWSATLVGASAAVAAFAAVGGGGCGRGCRGGPGRWGLGKGE